MPKRVDANQPEIVEALRRFGCSVEHLHEVGKGCPDILVGFQGVNYLFEIKDGTKKPSQRALTDDEEDWHDRWRGQVHIIHTFSDALEIITGGKMR